MDFVSIILIIVATLIGAATTYFFTKGKPADVPADKVLSTDNHTIEELQKEIESLSSQKDKMESLLKEARSNDVPTDKVLSTDNHTIEELQKEIESLSSQKDKMESLLEEARSKAENLSKQLKVLSSDSKTGPEALAKLVETDKLKKKIKQLEEDIEENEENIEEIEKKLKKRNAEIAELHDEKRVLDKDLKATKEEVRFLNEELKQKSDELKLKMEALSFVQSILSAPEFSDSITSNLYKKVDTLCNFIQNDLYDTLKAVNEYKSTDDSLFEDELKRWEAVQKKSWIAGKVAIAFVGEFSAGKTSIVNRILSQDDPNVPRLPVSIKPTTAIPTYISGGVKTDYRFFTQDNKLKKIEANLFNSVTKEVLEQVGGVSNLIQYFVMSYKNENLNSLSILDTPGFNSNDKEDGERTLEVINECDALFWVLNVNDGDVNKSSIDLIKKNLRKPLYIVINQVDTKADSDVDRVEKHIKDTIQREGLRVVEYIRFSRKAPLNAIMNPILSVKNTTNETEYPQRLLQRFKETQTDLQKRVKKEKTKLDKCIKKRNNLIDKFDQALSDTYGDCEIAVSIPRWEEHWFSSDRYEMDKDEFNSLVDILNRICNERMETLDTLYNDQMETQQEGQDTWRDYQESLANYQKIEECIFSLKKYIKKLYTA